MTRCSAVLLLVGQPDELRAYCVESDGHPTTDEPGRGHKGMLFGGPYPARAILDKGAASRHHSTDCLTPCGRCVELAGHGRFGCLDCDPLAQGGTCGKCGNVEPRTNEDGGQQ